MAKRDGYLWWQTVDYTPKMNCLGVLDPDTGDVTTPCAWPYEFDRARDARQRAKDHAKQHPTHVIEVINEKVSTYKWIAPEPVAEQPQTTRAVGGSDA